MACGNTVFEYTVKGILHDAIPISLEEAVDLKMGDILVYEKTPSKWKPWRKHRLVYSGININDALVAPVTISTAEVVLYNDATFSRNVSDSVGLDADVKTALIAFGVNFDIGEQKTLKGEFGQVKRMAWNLRDEVFRRAFKGTLNMDHPIVQDAKRHGSVLFVVTHLYQSAKVNITLQQTLTAGISGKEDDDKDNKDDKGDDDSTTGGDTSESRCWSKHVALHAATLNALYHLITAGYLPHPLCRLCHCQWRRPLGNTSW